MLKGQLDTLEYLSREVVSIYIILELELRLNCQTSSADL